jgi:DNA-binding MarR family transcriptional regulator
LITFAASKNKITMHNSLHIAPWIGITSRMIDNYFNNYFKHHGIDITKEQWILLMILSAHNGKSQNSIACLSHRDKTSLTRIINTLEHKNLIARLPSKEDKRINLLFVTTKGEQLIKETESHKDQILNELEKGISPSEIEQLVVTLKKIQTNMQNNSCTHN